MKVVTLPARDRDRAAARPRTVGLVLVAAVVVLLVALVVVGCADDSTKGGAAKGGGASTGGAAAGDGPTVTAAGDARVVLRQVATLDEPLAMVTRHGSDLLYAAERGGKVWALRRDGIDLRKAGSRPVLDLGDVVETGYQEQGLLGLAFSPQGDQLFVDYVHTGGTAGVSKVVRYDMDGDRVDAKSADELLSLDQPFENHNGGEVVIGPDGKLYVGLGDGGSQGDPDDHGQDPEALFAKILRMDLDGSHRTTYAMGLRNPWRFSFDPPTGDLWIGDVGGSEREEVDHLAGRSATEPAAAGTNFGWSLREGTVDSDKDGDRSSLVDPVHEYSHDGGGCSIVGGYRYRGTAVPGLVGRYVFGDFCLAQVRAIDPAHPAAAEVVGDGVAGLSSFAVDDAGELYAISLNGPIYRLVPRP